MCRKRFVFKRRALIILFIGIFILSACGQSENIEIDSDNLLTETVNNYVSEETDMKFTEIEAKAEEIHYYSEDGIDLLRTLHRCVSDGKNIYLVHGEPDLYIMPMGTDEHRPANIDNTEGLDVCNIALDTYGRIHLLMAGQDNEEWFIWRLNESYQVDKTIDISAYFETKHMPLWFLIDKEGTYYLQWIIDRDGIIVDSEGELKHRFTPESLGTRWIYEAAIGKNGNIYLVYSNSDVKLEIGELDVKECLIKNENLTLDFAGDEIFSAMSGGTDTNLLLFSPYSGVWAYDNEKGIIENRVPLSDIGFGSDVEFWPLTFLPDGRLLLLGQTVKDNHADDTDDESLKHWLLKYIPVGKSGCNAKSSAETKTKALTLAVFESEAQLPASKLLQWVNLYNENHSDVKIEIVNYSDRYSDPFEALNQIKIEISAGKGPDMINFGGQYSPIDASSGMLADLYPLMQNDKSFERQDFYYNILASFAVGDSLYVLTPSYRIDSYTTVNSGLSGLERMDIKQLIDAYNMLDDKSILFPGETKKAVFGMICYGNLGNYVDWGAGVCYFNGDSFKNILHFANQFPLSLNMANDYSAKEIFVEGRALLYPVSIDNVYGAARIRTLYGETPTYIGYPFDSGNGNMAAIVDTAIGISSTSKNKEDAWEFLRSLLDSEFQDNIERGLPLRVSSLEQKLEDARKAEFDSNGEKIVKEQLIFEGEDSVNIYEISNEDVETLKTIISKIEYGMVVDSNLYGIILEEADYLFNDDRNVDDVADIIQIGQVYI